MGENKGYLQLNITTHKETVVRVQKLRCGCKQDNWELTTKGKKPRFLICTKCLVKVEVKNGRS